MDGSRWIRKSDKGSSRHRGRLTFFVTSRLRAEQQIELLDKIQAWHAPCFYKSGYKASGAAMHQRQSARITEQGFILNALMFAAATIGTLAAVVIPKHLHLKEKAYDAMAARTPGYSCPKSLLGQ